MNLLISNQFSCFNSTLPNKQQDNQYTQMIKPSIKRIKFDKNFVEKDRNQSNYWFMDQCSNTQFHFQNLIENHENQKKYSYAKSKLKQMKIFNSSKSQKNIVQVKKTVKNVLNEQKSKQKRVKIEITCSKSKQKYFKQKRTSFDKNRLSLSSNPRDSKQTKENFSLISSYQFIQSKKSKDYSKDRSTEVSYTYGNLESQIKQNFQNEQISKKGSKKSHTIIFVNSERQNKTFDKSFEINSLNPMTQKNKNRIMKANRLINMKNQIKLLKQQKFQLNLQEIQLKKIIKAKKKQFQLKYFDLINKKYQMQEKEKQRQLQIKELKRIMEELKQLY